MAPIFSVVDNIDDFVSNENTESGVDMENAL